MPQLSKVASDAAIDAHMFVALQEHGLCHSTHDWPVPHTLTRFWRRGMGVTICCPGPVATGNALNPRSVMDATGQPRLPGVMS